jgi:hypothetical protein
MIKGTIRSLLLVLLTISAQVDDYYYVPDLVSSFGSSPADDNDEYLPVESQKHREHSCSLQRPALAGLKPATGVSCISPGQAAPPESMVWVGCTPPPLYMFMSIQC